MKRTISFWSRKAIEYVAVALATLLLAACGDSTNTLQVAGNEGGREVATLADRGSCTSNRDGDTVYVVEKSTDYLCSNGFWVDLTNIMIIDGGYSPSSSSNALNTSSVIRENVSVTGVAQSGELKKSPVTDTIYVYDGSNWIVAERETAIGLCQNSNAGVVSEFNGTYYICKNNAWGTATVLEYDTYGLTGVEGDVKAGVVNKDKFYVYENGTWRAAVNDQEVVLGACTIAREGSVVNGGDTYYICKSKTWTIATALEYDTYGLMGGEGDVKAGVVNKDKYYVYENGAWRTAANDQEVVLGVCTIAREGSVVKDGNTYYICKSKTWTIATALEYDTYGWLAGDDGEIRAGNVNEDRYYEYKNGGWTLSLESFFTDSRDGKIYRTVTIGTQTWMAENLNYADSIKTPSLLKRSWCYDNEPANCDVGGRLYTWVAAIDSVALYDCGNGVDCGYGKTCSLPAKVQGVCPSGWHLPTLAEWNILFTEVGGKSTAGKILKSQTGWYHNGNGTDGVGFSALPTGYRDYRGHFIDDVSKACFWSAAEYNSPNAYSVQLRHDEELADYYYGSKDNIGRSVRCLQD